MRQETISIVALPSGELGEQVTKTLRLWYKFGLVEDALLIPSTELNEDKAANFEVRVTQISDADSFFPLFEFLGETSYSRRDLVVPWYIGDFEPSLEMASVGALLASKIRISIARITNLREANETFFSTLLAIPSYKELKPSDLRSGDFYFAKYDLNAMASSEIKASPGASSIPVKQSWSSFVPFVTAQIVTAAGIWKGNPFPLSKIVSRFGSALREGEAKVVVFRSMTSAVVARNLAKKMVSKALEDAANPDLNPFQGGENRPLVLNDGSPNFGNPYFETSIEIIASEEGIKSESGSESAKELKNQATNNAPMSTEESKSQSGAETKKGKSSKEVEDPLPLNIIDKSIEDVANKVMQGFEESFNYERRPELKHRDLERDEKGVLKYFWNFVLDTFKSMPYYTKVWFYKKFAKVLDKLFGYVRQVKEKYFGLEVELLEKLDRINDLRSDSRKLDNLVLASAVFQENASLWKNLRRYAFASLDLKIDDNIGTANRVFPHFKYVATDPDSKYNFDSATAALLEIPQEINFDQSEQVRAKLLSALNSNTIQIEELKKNIEELEKPKTIPEPQEVEDDEERDSEIDKEQFDSEEELSALGQEEGGDENQYDALSPLPEIEFDEDLEADDSLAQSLDADNGVENNIAPEQVVENSGQLEDVNYVEPFNKNSENEAAQDESLTRFLDFGDEEENK